MLHSKYISPFHINTIIGYTLFSCVYGIFLMCNIEKNKWILFGSILIFSGYLFLMVEYYQEYHIVKSKNNKLFSPPKLNNEELQHAYQELELDLIKEHYFKGHLLLFLFHFLSTILPINMHRKTSDITAIIGHFSLFSNIFVPLGYLSLIIYYILYAIRNFVDIKRFFVNKLQVIAALMIIYHYTEMLLFMYEK